MRAITHNKMRVSKNTLSILTDRFLLFLRQITLAHPPSPINIGNCLERAYIFYSECIPSSSPSEVYASLGITTKKVIEK